MLHADFALHQSPDSEAIHVYNHPEIVLSDTAQGDSSVHPSISLDVLGQTQKDKTGNSYTKQAYAVDLCMHCFQLYTIMLMAK